MMHELIKDKVLPICSRSNPYLHDSAVLTPRAKKLAFTTDSFVVKPLFFPGGDIGQLAVYGTVNDLAMVGAKAQYMSLAFIIEEGLEISVFERILQSIHLAASKIGLEIVTGDTKVVERGKGDGLYINTTGIGGIESGVEISPAKIIAGDVIIVSGDLGRHGVAVMRARDELGMTLDIVSDCAPLDQMVEFLIRQGIKVHCLRDLTRGGLASALNELAEESRLGIVLSEAAIPVDEQVLVFCEVLGLEPYYLANEGRFICIVPQQDSELTLQSLKRFENGRNAAVIGRFEKNSPGRVRMENEWGSQRALPMLNGEQLPRIC